MYSIYIVENGITNKIYIGLTKNSIRYRWNQHCKLARYGIDTYLYRSIRKYGSESFTVRLLASGKDLAEANELETFYIWLFDANVSRHGYNMTKGGDGVSGNEEVRNKIKLAATGKKVSDETREKLRQFNLGKKLSEETKSKIGEFNRGKKRPPEVGRKISEKKRGDKHHFYGKKFSDAHRHNISIANSGSNGPAYRHDINDDMIYVMYACGLSTRDIAKRLATNRNTVSKRLKNMQVKLRPSKNQPEWRNHEICK